jgi:nicotinate-nucleotide adenylyltransferase
MGHLRAAEAVREQYALDTLYFVPAAAPPHKPQGNLASAADRVRMLELALADAPGLRVSTVEIERGGTSYSIDTIRHVLAAPDRPSTLVFVLGLDQFRDLGSWKEHAGILSSCDLVVLPRPRGGGPLSLADFPVASRKQFCYDRVRDQFRHESGHTVALSRTPIFDVSSTEIRRRVREGRSIRFLLPVSVERYIYERGLYGAPRGGSAGIES